ncbi:hypothetical protein QVD17_19980 [Tagetes erecta]|uniref:Uncharacterized protein n=1 Tax=Tagetes erecta TaxID=13708 RepID=A0AAD8KP21_TARER|nr:hypothetical protein QVD17_19980 [Tagetes erecta]
MAPTTNPAPVQGSAPHVNNRTNTHIVAAVVSRHSVVAVEVNNIDWIFQVEVVTPVQNALIASCSDSESTSHVSTEPGPWENGEIEGLPLNLRIME